MAVVAAYAAIADMACSKEALDSDIIAGIVTHGMAWQTKCTLRWGLDGDVPKPVQQLVPVVSSSTHPDKPSGIYNQWKAAKSLL